MSKQYKKFDNCIHDLKKFHVHLKNHIDSSFVCRFKSVIKYVNVSMHYNCIEVVHKTCPNPHLWQQVTSIGLANTHSAHIHTEPSDFIYTKF